MTSRKRRGSRWLAIAGLFFITALASLSSGCATLGGDTRARWAVDASELEVYGEPSAAKLVLSREGATEGPLGARTRAATERAAVRALEARGAVIVDEARADRVLHLDWVAIDSVELGAARVRIAARVDDGPRVVSERTARSGPVLGALCFGANLCCAAPISIPAAIILVGGLLSPPGAFGLVPTLLAAGVLVGVNAPGTLVLVSDTAGYVFGGGSEPALSRAMEELVAGGGARAPARPSGPRLRERDRRAPPDREGDVIDVVAF